MIDKAHIEMNKNNITNHLFNPVHPHFTRVFKENNIDNSFFNDILSINNMISPQFIDILTVNNHVCTQFKDDLMANNIKN